MPAKPARKLPDADSGPAAAKRFDQLVRQVISVPRDELAKRDRAWQKTRRQRPAPR